MLLTSFWNTALVAVAATSFAMGAQAQEAKSGPAKSPQAATPREQLKSEAKGLALATQVTEAISEQQLEIATHVLTGRARCEFAQQVSVAPISGQPGEFQVGFKNIVYRMVPEETTTGAVRLTDKKAGVIWLQIPTKSMLMNAKLGQRLVDNCMQTEQQVAADSAKTPDEK